MALLEVGRDPLDGIQLIERKSETQAKKKHIADAVTAAVKVMNNLDGTPTSIMGLSVTIDEQTANEIQSVDKLLKTATRSALSHQIVVGDARLIRLGLLARDWLDYKDRLFATTLVANLNAQDLTDYKNRIYDMAREINDAAASSAVKQDTAPRPIPWKRILIGIGVVIAGIFGFKVWKALSAPTPTPQPQPHPPETTHHPISSEDSNEE